MSNGRPLLLLSPGLPPRTGSISYINIIMPSVFGTICLLGIVGNSTVIFAVVKKSKDPYEDFKRSMMEMILEKQMFDE